MLGFAKGAQPNLQGTFALDLSPSHFEGEGVGLQGRREARILAVQSHLTRFYLK
jgi:hypothetical protein